MGGHLKGHALTPKSVVSCLCALQCSQFGWTRLPFCAFPRTVDFNGVSTCSWLTQCSGCSGDPSRNIFMGSKWTQVCLVHSALPWQQAATSRASRCGKNSPRMCAGRSTNALPKLRCLLWATKSPCRCKTLRPPFQCAVQPAGKLQRTYYATVEFPRTTKFCNVLQSTTSHYKVFFRSIRYFSVLKIMIPYHNKLPTYNKEHCGVEKWCSILRSTVPYQC